MHQVPGTLLGHYEILAPLGAGGMGEVYRARDRRLDREVAIKVLPPAARADREAQARFRREALALSRLNHPNIEMVLDLGEADGIDYLVLEFVPGETLAERLARGPIPEQEAAAIGAQIAEALTESHERGVLHRDLKPGNVMVTPKGRVKVLDFGLAKFAQPADDDTRSMPLTQVGTTTGTLAYMAPEQLLGKSVDARADLYALGVVLYEMMTGRRPFRATLATALSNEVLHAPLDPPRTIVAALSQGAEAVILRAMARDVERRYQTAGEILGELQRLSAAGAGEASDPAAAPAPARRVTSIAVLPLENLSGDAAQEYFSDGMTEELIASLAQVRALRIISRTSVMRYKGARRPIQEIARELNVDAVVEGSVRRAGNRVRITAQLIDATSERHLWARSYERDMNEVFALQGEVASAIVEEIEVSVTPQEATRLKGARSVDPEAYETYLKGRYFIERRTEADLAEGLALLERAARIEPAFELAHVGIADAHNLMGFMTVRAPREAFPRALDAARRALGIHPRSAEALNSMAYATLWYGWNPVEAERLFRRSIDLNPRYSLAHTWFANLLAIDGRNEEAEAEGHQARMLDPRSNVAIMFFGWISYWAGRFERSVARLEEVVPLLPEFGPLHYWLGLALTQVGRRADAVAAMERSVTLQGRTPQALAGLAIAQAGAGERETSKSLLAEIEGMATHRFVGAYYPAQIHVALGDHDEAFTALERALEERIHWLAALRVDPTMIPLREDPRFEALATRVKPE